MSRNRPSRAALRSVSLVLAAAAAACSGGGGGSPPAGPAAEPAGNRPPVAATYGISARANTPRTFALVGSDPDGNPLAFRSGSGPFHGTATISGGTMTYTPAAGFVGEDLLSYQVSDGWKDATSAGYVYLTVNEQAYNAAPSGAEVGLWTPPATPITFDVPVEDSDGDALTITLREAPRHGALSGSGARRTYTPAGGFVGTDAIGFDADDGHTTVEARVVVSVGTRPTFSAMTEEARATAMDAMASLKAQIDPDSDASLEQLEIAVRGVPGVAYVGRNVTGVWGQFQDGVAFLLGRYVPPGPVDPLPPAAAPLSAAPLANYIPTGQRAIILNALPLNATFGPNKGADLKPLLEAVGYTVDAPIDAATVEDFRRPSNSNHSVVYVRSHGGSGEAWDPNVADFGPSPLPALWTATPATRANLTAYNSEIMARRVVVMLEVEELLGVGPLVHKTEAWHLGISPDFIRSNWQLKPGAYVHLSACWLGNPWGRAAPPAAFPKGVLHDALFQRGAELVAGWTKATLVPVMDRAAAFAVDRMTGANLFDPKEDPPQRPMGAKTVRADMIRRGFEKSDLDGHISEFVFQLPSTAGGRFRVDRLAPSITFVEPDPATMKLTVHGDLMAWGWVDPARLRISVDGVEYPATSSGNDLVCDLPANASGDVIALVDGRKSNRVRLSQWNGTLTYRIAGPGSLSQEYQYRVRLVGDVHEFRESAGRPPIPRKEFWVPMTAQGSSASYLVQGANQDAQHKVTWSGGGPITPHVTNDSCDGCVTFMGRAIPEDPGKLWWNVFVGIQNAYDQQLYTWQTDHWASAGGGSQAVTFPLFGGMGYSGPLHPGMFALKLPAVLGADGTIQGGQIPLAAMGNNGVTSFTGWPLQHELFWGTMTPVPGSEIDPAMPR